MVHLSSSGIVTDYHLGYYLQNVVIVINMCNSEGYERVLKKMTSGQLGRSDRYRVRWCPPSSQHGSETPPDTKLFQKKSYA